MSFHQVRIRKDGPIHAIEHEGHGKYQRKTLCGLRLIGLEHIKVRLFQRAAPDACGRCSASEHFKS